MTNDPVSLPEIVSRNNLPAPASAGDDLATWLEAYFQLAVTTAESSRAVQRRDVGRFLAFMHTEVGHSQRPAWTPRLSRAFVNALCATLSEDGLRRWSDPTINRILAHLKTFASWVHHQQPFPLGAPLANLAALTTPTVLALERALTPAEQRQLLDAADLLVEIGGRSRDRRWSDSTINRILAHLKTFASWVHRQQPFPLGSPLAHLATLTTPTVLALERVLTPAEQRQLLDAADLLVEIGGRSRNRRAHGAGERPRRKGYRPYRNRAIVYTFLGTGMRRAALRNLNLAAVDFERRLVTVTEKGSVQQTYHISRDALAAIRDYLTHERSGDAVKWASPALFLAAATNGGGDGRLSVRSINHIWNAIARTAGVTGKTPHAARHAMGKRIMKRTGNVAAVQRQLGHRNASYALQYARPTFSEMELAINDE